MTDLPMDFHHHPSQLQGARDVHKPAAVVPGSTDSAIYPYLLPRCESTFQNADELDLHYKVVHHTLMSNDVLDHEEISLANAPLLSTSGVPSQPLSRLHRDADYNQNGFGAIEDVLYDPLVGHFNGITLMGHYNGLLNRDANFGDAFGFHRSLPSPSLPSVKDLSFTNKVKNTPVSSVVNGDQFNTQSLQSAVPVEAASSMVNLPALLPISHPASRFTSQNPAAENLPPRRHPCTICSKTFGRPADLRRHALKHSLSAQRNDCPFPGCPYTGSKGFLRSDKLKSHW